MIKVNQILTIVALAVYSAYIKGEQPVSVLITAPVEAGKTEIIMTFSETRGCILLTDATAYGIMRDYDQLIIDKRVRHILIPDLIKPMSRGKETVHSFITFLNSLIEEGVVRISTYMQKIAPPTQTYGNENAPIPVKCGLIAALAKDVLLDGRHQWSRMGFMSRMIPVSYDYGIDTQLKIHNSISQRKYMEDRKINLNLPDKDVKVELDSEHAECLRALATNLVGKFKASANAESVYGFRLQKQLQRLAMARALAKGRDTVNTEDVERIQRLSRHINLEYYPL